MSLIFCIINAYFLKADLNFKGKIFILYTMSCNPPTSFAIKMGKKIVINIYICVVVYHFISSIYLF